MNKFGSNSSCYNIVVFGGTSDIASSYLTASLTQKSQEKFKFYLLGRNSIALDVKKRHFQTLGADVETVRANFSETERLKRTLDKIPRIDEAFICFSELTNQNESEIDDEYLVSQLETNFILNVRWINDMANRLIMQNEGKIIVLGSVAGDLGRKRNYTYGSAKAGLEVFCQGVQHKIADTGVTLAFIKPGLVNTKMTAGLELNRALTSNVEEVGKKILMAVNSGKRVSYIPAYWRILMLVIKSIPWCFYKNMDI